MRYRSNGGVVGPVVTTNTSVAAGVWAMPDFQQRLGNSTWPTDQTQSLLSEPYFEYNTLLMKAVGANTTQNYTFTDSSTTATALTRNGDVTQGAFSPFSYADNGWSVYFDGSGDYMTVPNNAAFNFGTGDFTVECWIFTTSASNGFTHVIASTYQDATNGWTMGVYTNTNVLYFAVAGDSGQLNDNVVVPINQWVHVAAVRSGTTMSLFVNGVRKSTTTNSTNQSSTSALTVGTNVGGGALNHFGYISNLRVVKGTAVYDPTQSSITVPTTPLTAISGTSVLLCQSNRFKDNSTNNFTVTKFGDTKISAFGPLNPTSAYSTSVTGGSMYFDGTGDFLTATYSTTNFDWWTNDFTLEAWVYPTTLTNWSYNDGTGNRVCMFGNMNNADGVDYWSFGPASDGTVKLYYYNGSAIYNLTSTATVLTNQWNHIAVTRTSSGVVIFVNGVASSTLTVSGTPQSGAGTPLTLGRHNGYGITGYVSDLRLTKGSALYSGNFTPPTAPLTAGPNTKLLLNGTNAGIIDASRKFPLYSAGDAKVATNVVKYDKSVYFDGTGDYILIPTTNQTDEYLFGTNDFTVETWVRFSALASNRCIVDAWVSGQSASWQLYYSQSVGKIYWYVGASAVLTSSTTPLVDTWYHLAVARSGTTIRLFVNGTLEANTINHSTNYNYKAPLALGVQYSTLTNYLQGYMEDTRITRGYARYTANFTPPTTQLTTL